MCQGLVWCDGGAERTALISSGYTNVVTRWPFRRKVILVSVGLSAAQCGTKGETGWP